MAMAVDVGGGAGTLSEVYNNARRVLLRTRDGYERLERLESSSSGSIDSPELVSTIKRDISQIQSLCTDMDRLWRSIAVKSERDRWKRRVEVLAEDGAFLKVSLDEYQRRNRKRVTEAKERAELLGRASGDSAHVMRIFDDEAQAMQSARTSSMLVEEMQSMGVAIVSKYAEQREHLKRAHRKALDVLNTVGLSNSVLKLIERRHRVDKLIKYAGMVVTVIILYFVWRWS